VETETDDDEIYFGYDAVMTVGDWRQWESLPYPEAIKLDYKSAITGIQFSNVTEMRNKKPLENDFDLSSPSIRITATVGCFDIEEVPKAAAQALIEFAKFILNAATDDKVSGL
jgi:hypothetical protein